MKESLPAVIHANENYFYGMLASTDDIDGLDSLHKQVKSLSKMVSIYDELKDKSKHILKMQIAVMCKIIKHDDFVSNKHLASQEHAAAKYFSELTSEQIDAYIATFHANTPRGLYNQIHNERRQREFRTYIDHERAKIESDDDELSEYKLAAIEEIKAKIKEEIESSVRDEVSRDIVDDVLSSFGIKKGKAAQESDLLNSLDFDFREALTRHIDDAFRNKATAELIESGTRANFSDFQKSINEEIDKRMELYGSVSIDSVLRDVSQSYSYFREKENYRIFKSGASTHVRQKYDVVRVLIGSEKGDYVLLDYATDAQIVADLREKIRLAAHDLRAIKRRDSLCSFWRRAIEGGEESVVLEAARKIPENEVI